MSCNPLLEWVSFPFVERPMVSLFLILFLIALSFLMWNIAVVQWGYPIFYYGVMLLLLANLLPYFIVTKYSLFDDRIEIRYLFIKIERKLSDFKCFYFDKRGLMLSTFHTPKRLDVFRGQSLRFSGGKEEKSELIRILKGKIGKQY